MRVVPTAIEPIQFRQSRIFDLLYQIESKNAAVDQRGQTVAVNDLTALMGMMARFLFLATFTPVGVHLRARLNDDMADQLLSTDPHGLPTDLLSFGVAEIYLPDKELRKFAPSYLALKAIDRIVGQEMSDDDRNVAFLQFLDRLNFDENLFTLLDRVAQTETDDGHQQAIAEYIRARFRTLLQRPLQQRLNAMTRVAEELAGEIPERVELTADTAWEEVQAGFLTAVSQVTRADGLTPLITLCGALENFLITRQIELQQTVEELTFAKDELLRQKTAVEGDIASVRELAFRLPKKPSFFERLIGAKGDIEREIAHLKLSQLVRDLHQFETDNALFQLEILKHQQVIQLLKRLSGEIATLTNQVEQAKARSETVKSQMADDVQRFMDIDFRFHVPIGFCLIRDGGYRQTDVDNFLNQLVVDTTQTDTVEAVVRHLRDDIGEFWVLGSVDALDERLQSLIEGRLKKELPLWWEIKAQFSDAEIAERIRYCIRASAEYLVTDSAVNHPHRSWTRIVAAPQAAHEPLRKILAESGHSDFFIVDSADSSRISFAQVRVGIPLHSIKSHSANRTSYEQQSDRHDEERLHTRPEWRFLPDVAPIEDRSDPRISVYVLQGVVAGRLAHDTQSGSYWYCPYSGPRELIGNTEREMVTHLLKHQTLFTEVVSSFYARFHWTGSIDGLKQDVLKVAQNPGAFVQFINRDAFDTVNNQLEWVRQNYDIGK